MALTIPVADIVENSKNPLLGKHESWGRVLLGDIATIQNGFPFKSSQFTRDEGMPLIRIRDVGADNSETYYVGDYDPAFVVQAGDLLIGMDGDFNCARWRGPKGLLNQRVCRVILTSDAYHPRLLDYALPGYLKAINDMTSSVTVKHLSSKSIAEIPLPLPPMDQQKHIVAEIEKQFSRLDEAVANLKRVKANLKRYKAAVLKAAVEGGFSGGTNGWGVMSLKALVGDDSVFVDGDWVESKDQDPEGDVRLVQLADIGDGVYRDRSSRFLTSKKAEKLRCTFLELGDVLVARMPDPLGRACIFPGDSKKCVTVVDVCVIRPVLERIDRRWLMHTLNAPTNRAQIAALQAGSTRKRISRKNLATIQIHVPSHAVQTKVAQEVDRRFSIMEQLDTQIDANLQRAERLRQSILSEAFSGELLRHGIGKSETTPSMPAATGMHSTTA